MTQFKLFIVILMLFRAAPAMSSPVAQTDTTKLYVTSNNFSNTIDSIEKHIVDLTSASAVFRSKPFLNIYEHAGLYIDNVICYLQYGNGTHQQKLIAILSMQKKDLTNNIAFLRRCNMLYKMKLLTEEELMWVIYPHANNNLEIIKNYKLLQVRTLLEDIKYNRSTSANTRKNINKILAGEVYKEQKKWFAENGIDIN